MIHPLPTLSLSFTTSHQHCAVQYVFNVMTRYRRALQCYIHRALGRVCVDVKIEYQMAKVVDCEWHLVTSLEESEKEIYTTANYNEQLDGGESRLLPNVATGFQQCERAEAK